MEANSCLSSSNSGIFFQYLFFATNVLEVEFEFVT